MFSWERRQNVVALVNRYFLLQSPYSCLSSDLADDSCHLKFEGNAPLDRQYTIAIQIVIEVLRSANCDN